MRALVGAWAGTIAAPPLLGAQSAPALTPTHHFEWGLGGVGRVRYNRAESLYAELRGERTVARLSLHGALGWALTDPIPQMTVGTFWRGPDLSVGVDLFHRIQAVNPDVNPLGMFNSLSALVAGRDEGEYYRATGAHLRVAASEAEPYWAVTAYFERQEAPTSQTDFSLLGWPFPNLRGRVLAPVHALTQVGLEARMNRDWGSPRIGPFAGVGIRGRLETGGARVGLLSVSAAALVPIGSRMRLGWAGGAQVARGAIPPQRRALLGGPSRVRGFDGGAGSGPDAGWSRAELFLRVPFVTLLGFGDVGWAGDRSATMGGDTLAATGLGFTLLDDAIRIQGARRLKGATGWRFELYFDPLR